MTCQCWDAVTLSARLTSQVSRWAPSQDRCNQESMLSADKAELTVVLLTAASQRPKYCREGHCAELNPMVAQNPVDLMHAKLGAQVQALMGVTALRRSDSVDGG